MIPIRDTIPSRSFPIVNTIFIVVNTIVFFYEISLGNSLDSFIKAFGLIPDRLGEGRAFVSQTYPFFTSMFIHGGWFHLIGNMLYLYIFGDNVEDKMGHFKYLAFYLIAGIAAAFSQILTNLHSGIPMVGASGAISGVLGAYILYFPRSRVLTIIPIFLIIQFVEIPAYLFLLFWFVMQFFSGVASLALAKSAGGVAFWAHVGGFVAGFILAKLFEKKGYHHDTGLFRTMSKRN
ncbi:MAG: rhomboid family intramembrane serine protease [Candidatus Dadabacteria bacterium]|nr:rhomboid family intramembrane serine protease [Candidatus Dadabacteria bacterium]